MDKSDVAKFVAVFAAFLSMINVQLTPEQYELLVQIGLAIVTIIPLAYAMLAKNPRTGKQENMKALAEMRHVQPPPASSIPENTGG